MLATAPENVTSTFTLNLTRYSGNSPEDFISRSLTFIPTPRFTTADTYTYTYYTATDTIIRYRVPCGISPCHGCVTRVVLVSDKHVFLWAPALLQGGRGIYTILGMDRTGEMNKVLLVIMKQS